MSTADGQKTALCLFKALKKTDFSGSEYKDTAPPKNGAEGQKMGSKGYTQ